MKNLSLILTFTIMSLACKQAPIEEKMNPKKEITQVMIDFQNLLNQSSFTKVFYLATEEPYFDFHDKSYYNQAIENGLITEDTDILEYATDKVLASDLISEDFKKQIKANYKSRIDFSMWSKYANIGAILTDSEFGLDFLGPLLVNKYYESRGRFNSAIKSHKRYKNGFEPNPDSIMMSYDISPNEVYPHFIEMTSPTTASYYVHSKLIKIYGKGPRFVMDFVYSESLGWQINNMYYDDYKGNVLKLYSEFSN